MKQENQRFENATANHQNPAQSGPPKSRPPNESHNRPELPAIRRLQIIAIIMAAVWLVGATVASYYLIERLNRQEFSRQNEKARSQSKLIAQLIEKELQLAEQIGVALSHEDDILSLARWMNDRATKLEQMTFAERRSFLMQTEKTVAMSSLFDRLQNNVNIDVIFLLDRSGNCIASGSKEFPNQNHNNCLGGNYFTRRYFQQAKENGVGHQFAVGKQVPMPSLFFSKAMRTDNRFAGAVVVRVDALELLDSQRNLPSATWVTDQHGVAISTTRDGMLFRHIGEDFHPKPSASLRRSVYAREKLLPVPLRQDTDLPKNWGVWRLSGEPMVFARTAVKGRDLEVWHGLNVKSSLALDDRSWPSAIAVVFAGLLLILVVERVGDFHQRRVANLRIYVKMAEIGRELNLSYDVDKILQNVVQFVVSEFNYERCVALLEDPDADSGEFRVRAYEGYFNDEAISRFKDICFSGDALALARIYHAPGYVCHEEKDTDAADTASLGATFLMDEYFVFALQRKENGIAGFLVAGNSADRVGQHTRVAKDSDMLVPFSNLMGQTAITLANVSSYRALERERARLDEVVDERTNELSEALDAAKEAIQLKGLFLANVSHELRTPLNSIVNIPSQLAKEYSEMELYHCAQCESDFQTDGDDNEAVRSECPECNSTLERQHRMVCMGDADEHFRFLKLIEQQSAHLLCLVEEVLDFSRLDAGRVQLHFSQVVVNDVLEEVKATIMYSEKTKNCTISYPNVDRRVRLMADGTKLKQVLINLVGNAIKFTPEDGEIKLSVEETRVENDERVYFAVTDTGIGIPADKTEVIFESFRQVDDSHTKNHGGTGLGLAISKQIVEMHGGKIWAQSEIGVGSKFNFWLPVKQDIQMRKATSVTSS